jgi:hypothetical protein
VTRVLGVGVLTGWGEGVAALPDDAVAAAGGRRVIPLARPALVGDRFRRATRECLLGVAAVDAMLRDAGLAREVLGGPRTALVYVTAAAYGASNKLFVAGGGTLHFPYTAPSAVPAELAIEYGLRGGYVILVGGATAAIDALWQASTVLRSGRAERALVLAVETFAECEDLWARGRWTARGPLVEAAACALLDGAGDVAYGAVDAAGALETLAARRAGQTLACGPLIGLGLARDAGAAEARLTGHWRGRRTAVTLALSAARESAHV